MNYENDRRNTVKEIQTVYNKNISDIIQTLARAPEIARLQQVSETSGTTMTKFMGFDSQYSILDHCVGVALILDKFTKEDKQVIAGLLHGINKSAFSEAIRHMSMPFEEKSVYEVVVASDEVFDYLLKHNIELKDVCDYSIYPLVKAKGNRLDANSIENILHTSYVLNNINKRQLKEIYEDITVTKNEDDLPEFAFNTYAIGEKFCEMSLEVAKKYRSYEAKIAIKAVATLLELMLKRGEINREDLYKYGDKAIYEIGVNSSDKRISNGWKELKKLDKVYTKFNPVENKFCVKADLKVRYVDPLVRLKGGFIRASKVSLNLKENIAQFENTDTDLYMYGDFVI